MPFGVLLLLTFTWVQRWANFGCLIINFVCCSCMVLQTRLIYYVGLVAFSGLLLVLSYAKKQNMFKTTMGYWLFVRGERMIAWFLCKSRWVDERRIAWSHLECYQHLHGCKDEQALVGLWYFVMCVTVRSLVSSRYYKEPFVWCFILSMLLRSQCAQSNLVQIPRLTLPVSFSVTVPEVCPFTDNAIPFVNGFIGQGPYQLLLKVGPNQ